MPKPTCWSVRRTADEVTAIGSRRAGSPSSSPPPRCVHWLGFERTPGRLTCLHTVARQHTADAELLVHEVVEANDLDGKHGGELPLVVLGIHGALPIP